MRSGFNDRKGLDETIDDDYCNCKHAVRYKNNKQLLGKFRRKSRLLLFDTAIFVKIKLDTICINEILVLVQHLATLNYTHSAYCTYQTTTGVNLA